MCFFKVEVFPRTAGRAYHACIHIKLYVIKIAFVTPVSLPNVNELMPSSNYSNNLFFFFFFFFFDFAPIPRRFCKLASRRSASPTMLSERPSIVYGRCPQLHPRVTEGSR